MALCVEAIRAAFQFHSGSIKRKMRRHEGSPQMFDCFNSIVVRLKGKSQLSMSASDRPHLVSIP